MPHSGAGSLDGDDLMWGAEQEAERAASVREPRPDPLGHRPVEAAPLARSDSAAVVDRSWQGRPVPRGYVEMIDVIRVLLDRVAAAAPDIALVARTTKTVRELNKHMADHEVAEVDQLSGRLPNVIGRGQLAVPALAIDGLDHDHVVGRVWFGRHFLGSNGMVHGGAIPLVFDDLLGRLAVAGGRARSRTAYLNVDYRSVTPIETELHIEGSFEREDGRKRWIRGSLYDGDRLCAEADALFVELKHGQP